MTCNRCEELKERVAWLESELGVQVNTSDAITICRELKIRPQAGQIVLALYRAKGRLVSNLQLWDAIPQVVSPKFDDDRSYKMLDVQVCNARKGLGDGMIETVWGKGKALSPAGMARVAAILGEAS